MSNEQEKILVISSQDQDNDSRTNSNFVVTLKERYNTQNINKILVKNITVPNVFYNVRASNGEVNNTMQIQQDGDPIVVVTVPEGQYSISTYIPALKAAIDAVLTGGNVVTIVQDPLTKKLNFSYSLTAVEMFASEKDDIYRMADVIGLTNDTGPLLSMDMQSQPDLSGINVVYIHSSEVGEMHGIDGDFGLISLVESVSFHDVPHGAFAYRQNSDDQLAKIQYDQPKNLNRISIVLRDNLGNILDIGTKKMSLELKAFFQL